MIKNFKCRDDILKCIKADSIKVIGVGSSGNCFESTNHKVYKFLYNKSYDIEDVITEEEINLKSFAFPEVLYVADNKVHAYRTRLIDNDLFRTGRASIMSISNINFNNLSKSYKRMLKDIEKISKLGILLYDLPYNVTFNNKELVAIDTMDYKRVSYNPVEENVEIYNQAFHNYFKDILKVNYDANLTIKNNDIDIFLLEVEQYQNLMH